MPKACIVGDPMQHVLPRYFLLVLLMVVGVFAHAETFTFDQKSDLDSNFEMAQGQPFFNHSITGGIGGSGMIQPAGTFNSTMGVHHTAAEPTNAGHVDSLGLL